MITTLGGISSLITSGSRGWAEYYSENGALFLRMTNLSKEGIKLLLHDNKYVALPSSSSEGKRTSVKQNDILISITAELGKIGFVENDPGEAYVNQHVALVRISSSKADPKFLAYYLAEAHQRRRWQRLNDPGAKAALNLQTINKYPVTLPPLEQQIAVAALLSTWDTAIEKTERLIEAKEKKFSWLVSRLINQGRVKGEWRRVKLGDVVEINKGQQLNVADMVDTEKYYALNGGIEPSGFTNNWNTPKNTITISEGGNSCGFVNFNTEKFWCGGHCYALNNLSSEVSNKYLYHFLKAHEQLLMALRVGSGLPNIQKKDLLNITVTFPPLSEQNIIAEILNTARQEIDLLKKQAEAYRKQKRGLMQKLLTGEWRVKVD
jgi:type I restriction enzyme S subunit